MSYLSTYAAISPSSHVAEIITEGTRTAATAICSPPWRGMATCNHQKHAISGAKIKDVLVYSHIVQCPH
jgi:hypothetical protein